MLLSVITVAFRNYEGVMKTWQSLAHLAKAQDIEFEWIVVDGGSQDGTEDFLKSLNGQYNLRFISERDKGIYDAMNKGIDMASGRFAIFLNSGDIFHEEIVDVVRQLSEAKETAMYIGDALLDFGDGSKLRRNAKSGWYIYHSLPASHQAIFFPVHGLKTYPYDLQFKVSSDYALAARMFKAGFPFKRLKGWYLNFRWAVYPLLIISNYVKTPVKFSARYYTSRASGQNYPICCVYGRRVKQRLYITKRNART